MGLCYYSRICCALLYVHSSFAIILMKKREQVAFAEFVFLVSLDCCVALPRGALSLVCIILSIDVLLLISKRVYIHPFHSFNILGRCGA